MEFVAILSQDTCEVHLPDTTGNYATLCGMDGDDPDHTVDQQVVDVPASSKVNCPACIAIYDLVSQYAPGDFERNLTPAAPDSAKRRICGVEEDAE